MEETVMPVEKSANRDQYVEPMIERLADEFEEADGRPVDIDHVRELVEHKADEFEGAPVQNFVPLLVENHAVAELHSDGLHRQFEDLPEGPPPSPGDDPSPGSAIPTAG
jgi:hypothetical protein